MLLVTKRGVRNNLRARGVVLISEAGRNASSSILVAASVYIYIFIYTYIYIHIHIHTYTYVSYIIYTCIYVNMRVFRCAQVMWEKGGESRDCVHIRREC